MRLQTVLFLLARVTGAAEQPPTGFRSSFSRTLLHDPPQGFTPVHFCGRAAKVLVSIFSLGSIS